MRTVDDAYRAYRIMPALQLHQLRVGAVGMMVAHTLSRKVDAEAAVRACLFHDMGNIIKSDLTTFPEFTEPQGVQYWQEVKDDFVSRFGSDEHVATVAIAGELGLEERVIQLIDGVGFGKLLEIRDSDSYEQKIVEYADLRVGPYGILSLDERIEETRGRYASRRHSDMVVLQDRFAAFLEAAHDLEHQLFTDSKISPTDITDQSVEPLLSELRAYTLRADDRD